MILLPSPVPALEIRATSLEQALPQIGRYLGVRMRAVPAIEEQIVIARLQDASLETTKQRLGEAFSAEWRTDSDGTLFLTPSKARYEAERRHWWRARRERVEDGLSRYTEQLRRLPPLDLALARRLANDEGDLSKANPPILDLGERLMARLLGAMRPEQIVSETGGYGAPFGRIVYSTHPTRAQVGLGELGADALQAYRNESAFVESLESPEDAAITESMGRPSLADEITVTISQDEGGVSAELSIGTLDGGRVEREDARFGLSRFPLRDWVPFQGEAIPYQLPADVPDESRWFDRLPEEPLSFGMSDILLDAARRAGRSTIVAASDNWIGRLVGVGGRQGDLAALVDDGSGSGEAYARCDAPGWLTVVAEDPYLRRARFFPRHRLARFVRTLRNDTTLRELLEASSLRPQWPRATPVEWSLHQNLQARRSQVMPKALGLLASLSPAEWVAAERGPLPVRALSGAAQIQAYEILYGEPFADGNSGACKRPWPEGTEVDPDRVTLSLDRQVTTVVEAYQDGKPYRDPDSPLPTWERLFPRAHDPYRRVPYRQTEWTMSLGADEPIRIQHVTDRPVLASTGTRSQSPFP